MGFATHLIGKIGQTVGFVSHLFLQSPALREFFEVDHRFVTLATLSYLAQLGAIQTEVVAKAMKDMDISPDKANPMIS